ncbi:MAG: transposase [Beijerinckiaceae bacterium]|nr:transposase [Beijerinckiaceae bacterium]
MTAGTPVAEAARKHGIAPGRILAWRREARAKEKGEPAAPDLVKVHVAAPAPAVVMKGMRAKELPRPAQDAR